MKQDIHPKYRKVLFVDSSTGHKFVCGSTIETDEVETFEGQEYPVYRVSISSSSHPFFTGSKQVIDTEGRVDRFNKRYQAVAQKQAKQEEQKEDSKDKRKKAVIAKKRASTKKK
ncbi:MAG: type B 50S ribosomal protein L31 [Chlamydiales bacterium]